MTLTMNQRWLLAHMGGWQIVSALCSPTGTSNLMNSRWGSTGGTPIDGGPNWLAGWDTQNSTIRSTHQGGPQVRVTAKDINQFAREIPAAIKAELQECAAASTRQAILSGRFCHCGSKPCGYAYMGDRICPPTDEQEAADRAEYWRIRDWQDDLLPRALGLVGGQVGQLDLFEVPA